MLKLQFSRQFKALDLAIELNWSGSECAAIFGASGSGKSTLLRVVAGLDRKPSDHLLWRGRALHDLPPERRRIGMVFQEPRLFPHLTVAGNLTLAAKQGRGNWSLHELSQRLGFSELLHQPVCALSGGQQQRVAVARALLAEPELLLLDEPFSALDLTARHTVVQSLKALQREMALPLLLVSHQREEVVQLCQQLFVIDQGRIEAAGRPAQLFADPTLSIAREEQAGVILTARLHHYDPAQQLAELILEGERLTVTLPPDLVSEEIDIQVLAQDVVLATQKLSGVSLNNVVVCRLIGWQPVAAGETLVQLQLGSQQLLAKIAQTAFAQLDLKPQQTLYAYLKNVRVVG